MVAWQVPAAPNQRQTVAICQMAQKSRYESPIAY